MEKATGQACTKAYTHSRSLIEHKCKHTGTYLHECKDCGKRFTVNSNFKRHRDKVDCKAKLERRQQKESASDMGGDAKRPRRPNGTI